jgi:MFS family permease
LCHAKLIQSRGDAVPRRRALALWTVLAAQLMLAMDFLIVVVALPRIQADLGFSAAGLTWVPNAFGLAFGGLLLLGGRLGDMIGQIRAFRIGLIVFVLASLRRRTGADTRGVDRGAGGPGRRRRARWPSVLALVMVMARDEQERARGLSLFTAVSSIGASAGLILGGVADRLSCPGVGRS